MARAPRFVRLASREWPYARHWLIAVLILLVVPMIVPVIRGIFN